MEYRESVVLMSQLFFNAMIFCVVLMEPIGTFPRLLQIISCYSKKELSLTFEKGSRIMHD